MYVVTVAQFPHKHRHIQLVFAVIGSGLLYCTTRHQFVVVVAVAISELCWYAMITLMWLCTVELVIIDLVYSHVVE